MRNVPIRYILLILACALLASCGRKLTVTKSDTVFVEKKIEVKIRDTVKEKETKLLIDTVFNEIFVDCPDIPKPKLERLKQKIEKQCRISELVSPFVKDTSIYLKKYDLWIPIKVEVEPDDKTNSLGVWITSAGFIIDTEKKRDPTLWECAKAHPVATGLMLLGWILFYLTSPYKLVLG